MITKYIGSIIALEAIDRTSSFTAAARDLGLTQSSISMKVCKLENDLNVRLVERTTRSVALSPEGQELVAASRGAIQELEAAIARLQHRQEAGGLTVEAITSVTVKWLIPRLTEFIRRYPDISVRVIVHDDPGEGLHADADIAIRIAEKPVPGLHSHFLVSEPFFPVWSPSLARASMPREARDILKSVPLLEDRMALDDHSGCDWSHWMQQSGVRLEPDECDYVLFDRADITLQAALAGQGIALGRAFICLDDIERGFLATPFDGVQKMKWSYFLLCRPNVSDWPKVVAFRDWLSEEFGKSSEKAKELGIWY